MVDTKHHLYKGSYDNEISALIKEGYSAYKINKILQGNNCTISFMTVYRRVGQLKNKTGNDNDNSNITNEH